ncbi:hypothetical protein Ahy_A09g044510 isoform B [Arachis hypogaea]|nr:hypothetical protein Ahy_A09g044510 isoform B [Arachis hypogaea]
MLGQGSPNSLSDMMVGTGPCNYGLDHAAAGDEECSHACRLEEAGLEQRDDPIRDEEEGCAVSAGGTSLRRRLTEGDATVLFAGCAPGMGDAAGERKAIRGANSVGAEAYRVENLSNRVEGIVMLLEKVQGVERLDGHRNDACHPIAGGGNADLAKAGLGLDSARGCGRCRTRLNRASHFSGRHLSRAKNPRARLFSRRRSSRRCGGSFSPWHLSL